MEDDSIERWLNEFATYSSRKLKKVIQSPTSTANMTEAANHTMAVKGGTDETAFAEIQFQTDAEGREAIKSWLNQSDLTDLEKVLATRLAYYFYWKTREAYSHALRRGIEVRRRIVAAVHAAALVVAEQYSKEMGGD